MTTNEKESAAAVEKVFLRLIVSQQQMLLDILSRIQIFHTKKINKKRKVGALIIGRGRTVEELLTCTVRTTVRLLLVDRTKYMQQRPCTSCCIVAVAA